MGQMINGIDYLTADEAAQALTTTTMRILMLLRQGELVGRHEDGNWLVRKDSVDCCKTHGTDQKVAKGCATYCSSGGCGCK